MRVPSNFGLTRRCGLVLLILLTASGCAPSSAPANTQSSVANAPAVKKITAAIQADPPVLARAITVANEPGLDVIQELTNPGLAIGDEQGRLRPILVEQVPSVENGLWKVLPDGRMETTWQLRRDVHWHDGTPFTAADLLFTHRVRQDPDVPLAPNAAYRSVESIEAPDAHTFLIRWKEPYIEADGAFNDENFPAHLLERAYIEDKSGFTQLPYWSGVLVGVGPYQMREWNRGSNLLLAAFDHYPAGRPKIDLIDVKFIPDQNTLVANILAGTVEVTFGKTLTLEQALQVKQQWRLGRVESMPASAIQIFPQLLTPSPAVIGDARFRRALLHGVDREALADNLMFGLSSVVHSYLAPSEPPEFQAMGDRVVRYPYDPRRAAEILDGVGLLRGQDGTLTDPGGRRLSVEIRTITSEVNQQAMLVVADQWQRLGMGAETFVIPRQQAQDPAYRAEFPGLELVRNSADRDGLKRHPSSQTPLAENGYRGTNRTRYVNADFDALLGRYFTTIPTRERAAIFGDIVHHMTDQVLVLGLFYDMDTTVIADRLMNVGPRQIGSTQARNAEQWDVR